MTEDQTHPAGSRLHLGAAYYPEQWPEERWLEDIRLMREAGFTVVRMAEFAWSTFEPSEGEFHLDWLERAIAALADAGIVSVIGTPTAAPPAWLTHAHPDILAIDEHGHRVQHGNRCHYCVNSPRFHDATCRIVEAMAERLGPNPRVIGWQIDNEFNRVCYCDHCRGLFQRYLAEKFGSLNALNEHWTTAYWSQAYSGWEQIPIPIGGHNPGLMLEFKHFITESYRKFQELQLDTLRPHLQPGVWVTHNYMKWFGAFDHYVMSKDLDLASWDWYVSTGHNDYRDSGADHDLVRGYKCQNYWVMETQPGNASWHHANNTLNQGEGRVMAWHAVAHGADAILYWQWRSALNGQEQYHGTLLDQSGQPRPFYEEVQQLGRDFDKVSDLLAGSTLASAPVAILNDYDSRWSIEWHRHHGDFDYVEHLRHYYRPLAARNIAVDIISTEAPLDGYRLVIAPALLILNEDRAARLKEFVSVHRHLVLTLRCGMKDGYDALLSMRQPGPLAEIAGIEVEDYYALDEPVPVASRLFSGRARLWAERLKMLKGTLSTAMANYGASNGWLDGKVAITVNFYNHGFVYYVGAYLDDEAQQAFIDRVLLNARVRPVLKTPPGVEVRQRVKGDGEEIFIVINHSRDEQVVELPWPADEHLNELSEMSRLRFAPYGVAILTRTK